MTAFQQESEGVDLSSFRLYAELMKNDIDLIATYTASEIERGLGMPDRITELFKREKLSPVQVTPGGRGRVARYDFAALSHFVMIALLTRVTQNPVQAARVAQGIVPALVRHYGHVPFGFNDMTREILDKTKTTDQMRGPDGELCEHRTFEAAWRLGLCNPTKPLSNDYLLVIGDDQFVAQANASGLHYARQSGQSSPLSPLFRYRNAGPRHGLEIEMAESEVAEQAILDRLECAETLVQLNPSQALRRAVAAIIEMREATQ